MPEFAPLARRLAIHPPPGELQASLEQVAGALGFTLLAEADGWRLTGGDWLATSPNDVRCVLHVRQDGEAVELRIDRPSIPWTRGRMARLLAHRLEQAAAALEAIVGGRKPDLVRRPFSAGSDPADYCRSFSGHMVTMIAVMTAMMAAVTLASFFVIDGSIEQLKLRSSACAQAGLPVLPPLHEVSALTLGDRLGAAALLAMPIAFFFGALLTLGNVLGEIWWRASRLPLVATAFAAIVGVLAFTSVLPLALGLPLALLIPLGGWVAAGIVWGRRSERVGVAFAGTVRRRVAGVLLALTLTLLLFPWPRGGAAFTDQLALFRDRYLLTHRPGMAFAHLYYRVTLYSAEAVKPAFDGRSNEESYEKLAPLALVIKGSGSQSTERILRALGVMPIAGDAAAAGNRAYDLVVAAEPVVGAGDRLLLAPKSADPAAWRAALLATSERTFRGGWLLEVVRAGWQSIYYLGALFGVLLVMTPLAGLTALLYRQTSPRGATVSVAAVFVVTVGSLLFLYADRGPELSELASLRRADRLMLQQALGSPFDSVKHEAAYRLYRGAERPDLAPLLGVDLGPNSDPRVRLWVCGALGRTKDSNALGSLAGLMGDRELLVRYRAAEGLGLLYEGAGATANEGATRLLETMMRTGSWYEATYAFVALHRIDPERW